MYHQPYRFSYAVHPMIHLFVLEQIDVGNHRVMGYEKDKNRLEMNISQLEKETLFLNCCFL